MKNIKIVIVAASLCLTFAGCEKMFEIYMGVPLQPKNINSEYVPGLNIFGMLKAGPTYDTLNHYFEVEQIIYVFDTTTIISIDSAIIELARHQDNGSETKYTLMPYGEGKYTNPFLDAKPGDVWNYQCIYDTFNITSQTLIPNEPQIKEGSLKVTNSNLSFVINTDPTAFMYDVFYIDEMGFYTKRIVPQQGINTEVSFDINFSSNSQINQLFVYAYDKNYEEYITTSNIFFKPNAFRPRFTTVEGGWGCFCSASSLMVDLEIE